MTDTHVLVAEAIGKWMRKSQKSIAEMHRLVTENRELYGDRLKEEQLRQLDGIIGTLCTEASEIYEKTQANGTGKD